MTRTTHPPRTLWQRVLERQHRRQQRFAERTAHRLPTWRTRRHRRAAVRVAVAGLVLMLVGAAVSATGLPNPSTAVLFLVTWGGGTLVAVAAWFVLRVLTSNVADLPTTMLDEREADQRAAVRSVALQVTLWAALAPLFLLIFGSRVDEPSRVAYPAGLLLAVVIVLGGFVPAALLAWDAPDPDPLDTTTATTEDTTTT